MKNWTAIIFAFIYIPFSACYSADVDKLKSFNWGEKEPMPLKADIVRSKLLNYLNDSEKGNFKLTEIRYKSLGFNDYWVIEGRFVKLSNGPPEDFSVYMDFNLKIYSDIEFKKILGVIRDLSSPEKETTKRDRQ